MVVDMLVPLLPMNYSTCQSHPWSHVSLNLHELHELPLPQHKGGGGDHTLVMFGPQSHAGLCVMLCKLPQGGDENLIMYNTGDEVHVECVQDLIRSLHKSIFFQYFSLSLRMF